MSCRVYSSVKGIHQVTLLGHRSTVCACFFEKQSLTVSQGHTHHAELVIQYRFYYSLHYYYFVLLLLLLLQLYTVSKDGAVIVWEPSKSAEEIEEYLTNEGNKEEEQEEGTRGREDEADSSDNEEGTGEGRGGG